MPEGVAEHSFLGCNHQSTCMSSYSLYVQLFCNPMYYPGGLKAWVGPVQWSEPHSILAPIRVRTRAVGFRIINGDHYTTTAHWVRLKYSISLWNETSQIIHLKWKIEYEFNFEWISQTITISLCGKPILNVMVMYIVYQSDGKRYGISKRSETTEFFLHV